MTLIESLGAQVAALRYEDIPAKVIDKLRTCVLYGVSMAAANEHESEELRIVRAVHNAPGPVRTLVAPLHLSAADAAFANAALMCSRGQNDTFPATMSHAGCVAIPAVLAAAQECGASGRDVLVALAAGYETAFAIAEHAFAAVVARGFRPTPVFGVFASAAAVARLYQLDATQTARAIGIASQFAGGTMQTWTEGTPEWQLQSGHAARSGIVAAQLARGGYRSASQALEGKAGFFRAFAGEVPQVAERFGWATADVVFKPMPGCLINQAPLYLFLQQVREHAITEDQLDNVHIALSPISAGYPGVANHGPFASSTGAIMSCALMLAVGLREGTLKMRHFGEYFGEGSIHALSQRFQVAPDAQLTGWATRVSVTLKDGRCITGAIEDLSRFCLGWDETDALLSGITDEWPFPDGARRYARLRQIVLGLDHAASVEALIDTVRPDHSTAATQNTPLTPAAQAA